MNKQILDEERRRYENESLKVNEVHLNNQLIKQKYEGILAQKDEQIFSLEKEIKALKSQIACDDSVIQSLQKELFGARQRENDHKMMSGLGESLENAEEKIRFY